MKELGNRERSDQVRKDVEQGREVESEINAHRISKQDEENFVRIAKMDCRTKKGEHHFRILDGTATHEYWVDRGHFLWEEQMQDSVVESQMKRGLARKAESERVSNSQSGARIFGEEETEKSKKIWKEVAIDSRHRVKILEELTAKAAEKLCWTPMCI